MKEINFWQAFDGKKFTTKKECENYETNHILYDSEAICFYSNRGHLITNPCEHVFLDSNKFKVNNQAGLEAYIEYCRHFGLAEPHIPTIFLSYPLHFRYLNGWECMEEKIEELRFDVRNEFNDDIAEKEMRHNFVDCG